MSNEASKLTLEEGEARSNIAISFRQYIFLNKNLEHHILTLSLSFFVFDLIKIRHGNYLSSKLN